MSRIDFKFKELRAKKKKAFVAFMTAGDPNLKTTEELVLELEKVGVDIIELGVPFSDPLADGPTIQAASYRALENGTNLEKIFNMVGNIRKKSDIPIALMSYYNPIFSYGEYKFIAHAKKVGVDGVIIPDLPPEEATVLSELAKASDISTIFFVSPTTTQDRMKKIAVASTGFIYYVAVTGVTGARTDMPKDFDRPIKQTKKLTDTPICVGFGISTPEQVKKISQSADGVIVGSAIVKEINRQADKKDCAKRVARFVRSLAKEL